MTIALHHVALIAASSAAIASLSAPAHGQADRAIVMTILGECAKIGDPAARTACFDNNIGIAGPAAPTSAGTQDRASLDRNVMMNILIECAKIAERTSRMSCYDSNMRGAGSLAATTQNQSESSPAARSALAGRGRSTPGAVAAHADPRAPAAGTAHSVDGFGRNANEATRITPTVASVTERRPGAYLLTLQDGAQWEFVEDMPPTYEAPARGSVVEIERGTFGSFLMRFDRQRPVRVQRIR